MPATSAGMTFWKITVMAGLVPAIHVVETSALGNG
jgi:hypothetical protein